MFEIGQKVIFDRKPILKCVCRMDFALEAWNSISHYVYAALQGGSIMEGRRKKKTP